MQIPIVKGIFTDLSPDIRTAYPKNMIAIPKQSGISAGYLKPHDGLIELTTSTQGVDRGGIEWDNKHYRVLGSKLVEISSTGTITELGDVGTNGKQVSFAYSADRLAVVSNLNLFYWDKTTFIQVTDPDLGDVYDVVWVDGYFMLTDGEFLIVTELSDPTQINPLKYGSSEADPDPIIGLEKVANEVYALNRFTIEVFDNVGGSNFPFARIESAQVDRGCIGTHAKCKYLNGIAFLGSGKNESPAIWLGINSDSTKISTKEIDRLLQEEGNLEEVVLEARIDKTHQFLYIHLSDKTLVYDPSASNVLGVQVWFILDSNNSQYKAKNFIWVYDKWYFGDPTSNKIGYLDEDISTHFGVPNDWEFQTGIVYNESRGAIIHQLELVAITGNLTNGTIYTSFSLDTLNFSQEIGIDVNKRLVWFQQGGMQDRRIQKFRGNSHISIARLEVQVEPLYV